MPRAKKRTSKLPKISYFGSSHSFSVSQTLSFFIDIEHEQEIANCAWNAKIDHWRLSFDGTPERIRSTFIES